MRLQLVDPKMGASELTPEIAAAGPGVSRADLVSGLRADPAPDGSMTSGLASPRYCRWWAGDDPCGRPDVSGWGCGMRRASSWAGGDPADGAADAAGGLV